MLDSFLHKSMSLMLETSPERFNKFVNETNFDLNNVALLMMARMILHLLFLAERRLQTGLWECPSHPHVENSFHWRIISHKLLRTLPKPISMPAFQHSFKFIYAFVFRASQTAKWISHEWKIILQSSFLCHPLLNGHGIDHEAISMWKQKLREILVNCCACFTPVALHPSQNDGDHKNKSRGEKTRASGALCLWCYPACIALFGPTQRHLLMLSIDQALNWIALELHEMESLHKEMLTINCIQINASWPSCQ